MQLLMQVQQINQNGNKTDDLINVEPESPQPRSKNESHKVPLQHGLPRVTLAAEIPPSPHSVNGANDAVCADQDDQRPAVEFKERRVFHSLRPYTLHHEDFDSQRPTSPEPKPAYQGG